MPTNSLFTVILAGGSGTRLWPLSRKNYPKQFLCLHGEQSLLQQTVQRSLTLSAQQTLIVSNESHYFLCQDQLQGMSNNLTYLLEPHARNTAAAIASAAHSLVKQGHDNATMLILPSDHWMSDTNQWKEAMLRGIQYAATHPAIVTFGITPDSPKTGYGYIRSGEMIETSIYSVHGFHEKPNESTAEQFLREQCYYWNSGMFACQAKVYLQALKEHAHDIFTATEDAVEKATHHHDYWQLSPEAYETCRSESIDYAIMEKINQAVVIPVDMPWNDLGCWSAVLEANPLDDDGNALRGNVMAHDSHHCFISSQGTLITALGVQNQIIVATNDAVLVADKRYSQQVKDIVGTLTEQHSSLVSDHTRVMRPWGYFEILAEGKGFKVKRLMVKPGAAISLQMHHHRAEHWVVVGGFATVIHGDYTLHLSVNQSTYIPQKTRHRLSNNQHEPLFVIEVQTGDYLGEDDIIRFADDYERVAHDISENA